jgi:pullulanase/glycogen debranching enzyme
MAITCRPFTASKTHRDRASIICVSNKEKSDRTCCCHKNAPSVAGDEIGRTQMGNNIAYCQDNHISWRSGVTRRGRKLLEFVKQMIRLRVAMRSARVTAAR